MAKALSRFGFTSYLLTGIAPIGRLEAPAPAFRADLCLPSYPACQLPVCYPYITVPRTQANINISAEAGHGAKPSARGARPNHGTQVMQLQSRMWARNPGADGAQHFPASPRREGSWGLLPSAGHVSTGIHHGTGIPVEINWLILLACLPGHQPLPRLTMLG